MFGLILGEIGAIEAQKVRWADSTPPWFLNGPKSLVCLGLRSLSFTLKHVILDRQYRERSDLKKNDVCNYGLESNEGCC